MYSKRAALLSATALMAGVPVAAQEVVQETAVDSADDNAIIVTARRDAERLEDVPASVSVLTTDALEKTGATTTEDIVQLTSGVTITTGDADIGDTQINIRGLNGTRDAENNVGLVVDGILKTNASQLNQVQGELAQVEILKGPQGAYYGRGAAAGAIVLTTRKPGDELSVFAEAGLGENSLYYGQASVSGPISDGMGFVLFGDYRKTDGFYRNTGPIPAAQGATVDRLERWNVGGRLVAELSPAAELDIKARYGKADASALSYDVIFNVPGFASLLGNPLFNEDANEREFAFVGNIVPDNNQRTIETSAKLTFDMDWATLTAWALYSDVDQDFLADGTLGGSGRLNNQPACIATTADLFAQGVTLPSPQGLGPTPAQSLFGPFGPTACDGIQYTIRDQKDISAEVRLSSTDGPLRWSVGAYYLHIDRQFGLSINEDRNLGVTPTLFNPPGSIMPTTIIYDDIFTTDVFAGFGSAEVDVGDRLTLSAALRYDREERDVRSQVPNAIDPVTGDPINPGLAFGPIEPNSRAFTQLQPKLSAVFEVSDYVNVFANWGVGFKAGGFNQQGTQATIETFFNGPLGLNLQVGDEYRKEKTSAFEVGFKGSTPDNRLSITGAAFYTDVTDMQFWEVFTGGFGLVRTVSNIDEVEIYGAELSVNFKLLDDWSFFAAGNVTESEIKENNARPNTVGNKSPYTADYTLNVGTQIEAPISSTFDLVVRADWRLTGPTWFHAVQGQDNPTLLNLAFGPFGTGNYTNSRRDAFSTIDLRTGLSADNWTLTVFANNLLNEQTISEIVPAAEFGGSFVAPGTRRTIGVEASVRF